MTYQEALSQPPGAFLVFRTGKDSISLRKTPAGPSEASRPTSTPLVFQLSGLSEEQIQALFWTQVDV